MELFLLKPVHTRFGCQHPILHAASDFVSMVNTQFTASRKPSRVLGRGDDARRAARLALLRVDLVVPERIGR
jgi:hypothetical protein